VATKVYGAEGVDFDKKASTTLKMLEEHGYGKLPVCLAKTQMSLSDDPKVMGRPRNFRVAITEVRLSAGAGFVVALCGSIMTMPGLPKKPAAESIDIDKDGNITGLF
ncbi:MAG TPA: formate--tetrahydrofolate ligase, partial [Synergistaceae bacterium]|nr:formate--tetrahydrofolate ligase [Synergistaceae bacterium]